VTFNPMDLTGKRILVTGASSGIGKETAQIISKLGGKVILLARDESRLREVFEGLIGNGHAFYTFNLTATDDIPAMMKAVAKDQGFLTGVFHSAGLGSIMPVSMLKKQYIDAVFDVSVASTLMIAKGFCRKGVLDPNTRCSLVFMSSITSLCGVQGLSLYSASKAAVDGAMRSLARELVHRNIRVNTIASGAVKTGMHDEAVKNLAEEEIQDYEQRHLLGFGNPEDVAYAAAFLLSDAAAWITGTTMIVDGGYCCP
jgi:NAD(P)-dependent dehydrogenase (short-subunit alcohol dehydrogenase family)